MVRATLLVSLLSCLLAMPYPRAASSQGELVIVKEGTTEYHRPACRVIRDATDVLAMTRAQAEGRKYKPHPACDPDNPASEAARPPSVPAAKPAPPQFVFVDGSGKLYHRQTCKRLGPDPKKIALDDAGRKYWPCTVCKPPIRKRPAGSK